MRRRIQHGFLINLMMQSTRGCQKHFKHHLWYRRRLILYRILSRFRIWPQNWPRRSHLRAQEQVWNWGFECLNWPPNTKVVFEGFLTPLLYVFLTKFQFFNSQNQFKLLTKYFPSCLYVFSTFVSLFIDVDWPKSKIKWKSSRWFTIPSLCYYFGNGSKVAPSQFSKKKDYWNLQKSSKYIMLRLCKYINIILRQIGVILTNKKVKK